MSRGGKRRWERSVPTQAGADHVPSDAGKREPHNGEGVLCKGPGLAQVFKSS